MVRLFFVYAALFALLLCASSGVLGATVESAGVKPQVARVSLETLDLKKDFNTSPVFGSYYYTAESFKGDFQASLKTLASFVDARKKKVEEFKLENGVELSKLKEEHRQLMLVQSNLTNDETKDDYSKWAVSMYSNIGRQALLKQTYQEKIANWDRENFVEVKSIHKDGKRFLAEILIKKNRKAPKEIVATNR